ncbi:MAG: bifunctional folylpolyglutamate synthase/dihydrofolate synthase [Pseudomonadales bacterium]|nr:bifunctional folylpolyglutamate synthase/dihydrofolate synthase [Pseudomonadales bacterium]
MTDIPIPATLPAWLERIESMHPAEIELGLDRLRQVADRLGVASLPGTVVTVAGTNGKGSTVALMTALAERQGRRVCVYTSPHLHRFNERVRLPDGPAPDARLCEAFERVEAARGDIPLTYFEFTTLAALWLFCQSGADLFLLEVGLGGRLDAVNLIDADVAVVTSVGLDHQDWLGDTREAIAREKCGIGRRHRPLVYGETDWPANLLSLIEASGASGVLAGREFEYQGGRLTLANGLSLTLPPAIRLGHDNLATACQALALAGIPVSEADCQAVAGLSLYGRCESFTLNDRACWFDVGHNVPAVARFLSQLPPSQGERHLVFGMMADKPIKDVVALFAGQRVRWYLAAPAVPRAATVARLRQALPDQARSVECNSVKEALDVALAAAKPEDQVLIFGSFFTVAEARPDGNGDQGG